MLTQCPNCQTIFRITSEILRVAQGQVRCGRCHTQFDALQRLIEESDVEETGSGRYVRPDQPPTEIEVDEPPAQEDITLEGRHIEITGTYRVMDDSDDPQIRQEVTEEWVEIDDADELPSDAITDDTADDDGIEVYEGEPDRADLDDSEAEEDVAIVARESEQERFARRLAAQRERSEEESASESELAALSGNWRRTTATPLVWKVLAAPLVIALLAQIIHHYRSDLARSASLGPAVVGLYGALGAKLTPDWQLHSYEVKQWGVISDASRPGTLRVRASVTNKADFPQPYPLLRLSLEDRWGDQVRGRDFQPSEYLDVGTSTDRLMTPGQPSNATIVIVDPGPDAEGFRFDVCLPGKAGGVVCAAEVPQ